MDVSSYFLEAVRRYDSSTTPKSNIFPRTNKTPLVTAADEILSAISRLQQFLQRHSSQYVNANRHLYSYAGSEMSEQERDEIDQETRVVMKNAYEQIDKLKNNIEKSSDSLNPNHWAHLHGILAFLSQRLQSVSQYYSEQRALRYKNADAAAKRFIPKIASMKHVMTKTQAHEEASRVSSEEEIKGETNPDTQLNEQERALLESENQLLQQELETMVDQTRKIEKQIMEISELQQIFSVKVAQQAELIEHNYQMAIEFRAHVDRGNKELLQATKRGVDFRVFVLLFLVVASFSLLFLDWLT